MSTETDKFTTGLLDVRKPSNGTYTWGAIQWLMDNFPSWGPHHIERLTYNTYQVTWIKESVSGPEPDSTPRHRAPDPQSDPLQTGYGSLIQDGLTDRRDVPGPEQAPESHGTWDPRGTPASSTPLGNSPYVGADGRLHEFISGLEKVYSQVPYTQTRDELVWQFLREFLARHYGGGVLR